MESIGYGDITEEQCVQAHTRLTSLLRVLKLEDSLQDVRIIERYWREK